MPNDSVQVWKQRVDAARAVHQRWLDRNRRYRNAYVGHFDDWYEDEISPNWVRRVIDSAVTNLWYHAPTVEIPPVKGLDAKWVNAASTMINQVIEESKAEEKYRRAVFHGLLYGCGWVKFGYHGTFPSEQTLERLNTDPFAENDAIVLEGRMQEAREGEDHKRHIDVHQALFDSAEALQNLIAQHGLGAPLRLAAHIQQHRRLQEKENRRGRIDWRYEPKQIWCESVDPREVLIDPNATCLEDARWIAFRLVKPVGDVKRDPALKHTAGLVGSDVQEFQGDDKSRRMESLVDRAISGGRGQTTEEQDPEDSKIELWQIFDRKTGRELIVTDQSEEFLLDRESIFNDVPGLFPCVQILFQSSPAATEEEEPERAYGESIVAKFWAEQVQLNSLAQVSLDITKASAPRYVAAPGVDETFLKNLEAGVPMGVCKLTQNYKGDPRYALTQVPLLGNTNDLMMQIRNYQEMIQFKSGFSEIQLQGVSTAKTATASQVQATSAGAVLDAMLSTIQASFVEGCKIIRALIIQFYDEPRVIELTGEDGRSYVTLPHSQLVGATWGQKIVVRTGSQSPSYDAMKINLVMTVYNLLAKNPYLKLRDFTKWALGFIGLTRSPEFIYSDSEVQAMLQQQALLQAAEGGQEGSGAVDPNTARATMNAAEGNGGPQPPQNNPPQVS